MKQFETLTEALQDLKQRGYVYDFNLADTCLHCPEMNLMLHPSQFEITEYYRFEGMTDPADSMVAYAIESHEGVKGVVVNAYGVYADSVSADLIRKLRTATSL